MSEVKRWAHHVTWDGELKIQATMMALRSEGEYVLASDYDALAAECERLRDLLTAAQEKAGIYADLRDKALAELAALKGGQVYGCPRCGTGMQVDASAKPYTAPPAQASAWAEGFRVMKPTSAVVRDGDRWEIYAPCGSGGIIHEDDVTDWVVRKLLDALAAAPTPGASDGKGGE